MYVHLANASTVFLCFMSCFVYLYVFKCMCCYCFYVGKKLYTAYVCNVTLETRLKIKFSILFYSILFYSILFYSILFCGQHRVRTFIFFQNLTLGYMTKTLNQIIIFFLHQNQNIFFSNNGNQNIFLENNHNPPWTLNGPSLKHTQKK